MQPKDTPVEQFMCQQKHKNLQKEKHIPQTVG